MKFIYVLSLFTEQAINSCKFINVSRASVLGRAGGLGREHILGQVFVPKLVVKVSSFIFLRDSFLGKA